MAKLVNSGPRSKRMVSGRLSECADLVDEERRDIAVDLQNVLSRLLDLTRFGGHRDKPVEGRRRSVQWQENRPRNQQRASGSGSHLSTSSKQFASATKARSRSRRWRPIWESRQISCIGGAGSTRIVAWPRFPAAAKSTRMMRSYIVYDATSGKSRKNEIF